MPPLPTLHDVPALPTNVPAWPRAIRLTERWTITEQVDGTHAVILIKPVAAETEDTAVPGVVLAQGPGATLMAVRAASRTRWLVPEVEARRGAGRDNFGLAAWVAANAAGLAMLGPGAHHGQWYGVGIGRGYGLAERRLALLDTTRWQPHRLPEGAPAGLGVVPVLSECEGGKLNAVIARCLTRLAKHGSSLVPGAAAEGVIAASAADPRFIIEATATATVAGAGRSVV
jgi:hypothetical protein